MDCGQQHSAWASSYGQSFESVRMGVKDISARWLKASKALKKGDQVYGQKVAEMAKKHSSEAFYALDDSFFPCHIDVDIKSKISGLRKKNYIIQKI
jgi:hypothetical protein